MKHKLAIINDDPQKEIHNEGTCHEIQEIPFKYIRDYKCFILRRKKKLACNTINHARKYWTRLPTFPSTTTLKQFIPLTTTFMKLPNMGHQDYLNIFLPVYCLLYTQFSQ